MKKILHALLFCLVWAAATVMLSTAFNCNNAIHVTPISIDTSSTGRTVSIKDCSFSSSVSFTGASSITIAGSDFNGGLSMSRFTSDFRISITDSNTRDISIHGQSHVVYTTPVITIKDVMSTSLRTSNLRVSTRLTMELVNTFITSTSTALLLTDTTFSGAGAGLFITGCVFDGSQYGIHMYSTVGDPATRLPPPRSYNGNGFTGSATLSIVQSTISGNTRSISTLRTVDSDRYHLARIRGATVLLRNVTLNGTAASAGLRLDVADGATLLLDEQALLRNSEIVGDFADSRSARRAHIVWPVLPVLQVRTLTLEGLELVLPLGVTEWRVVAERGFTAENLALPGGTRLVLSGTPTADVTLRNLTLVNGARINLHNQSLATLTLQGSRLLAGSVLSVLDTAISTRVELNGVTLDQHSLAELRNVTGVGSRRFDVALLSCVLASNASFALSDASLQRITITGSQFSDGATCQLMDFVGAQMLVSSTVLDAAALLFQSAEVQEIQMSNSQIRNQSRVEVRSCRISRRVQAFSVLLADDARIMVRDVSPFPGSSLVFFLSTMILVSGSSIEVSSLSFERFVVRGLTAASSSFFSCVKAQGVLLDLDSLTFSDRSVVKVAGSSFSSQVVLSGLRFEGLTTFVLEDSVVGSSGSTDALALLQSHFVGSLAVLRIDGCDLMSEEWAMRVHNNFSLASNPDMLSFSAGASLQLVGTRLDGGRGGLVFGNVEDARGLLSAPRAQVRDSSVAMVRCIVSNGSATFDLGDNSTTFTGVNKGDVRARCGLSPSSTTLPPNDFTRHRCVLPSSLLQVNDSTADSSGVPSHSEAAFMCASSCRPWAPRFKTQSVTDSLVMHDSLTATGSIVGTRTSSGTFFLSESKSPSPTSSGGSRSRSHSNSMSVTASASSQVQVVVSRRARVNVLLPLGEDGGEALVAVVGTSTALSSALMSGTVGSAMARATGALRMLDCPITDRDRRPPAYELPIQADFGGRLGFFAGAAFLHAAVTAVISAIPFLFMYFQASPRVIGIAAKVLLGNITYFGPFILGGATTVIAHPSSAGTVAAAVAAVVVVVVARLRIDIALLRAPPELTRSWQGAAPKMGMGGPAAAATASPPEQLSAATLTPVKTPAPTGGGSGNTGSPSFVAVAELGGPAAPAESISDGSDSERSSGSGDEGEQEEATKTLRRKKVAIAKQRRRHRALMEPFVEACRDTTRVPLRMYNCVEFSSGAVVSVLAGIRPDEGCNNVAWFIALFSISVVLYLIAFRPYARRRDMFFCFVANVLQAVLSIFTLLAVQSGDPDHFAIHAVRPLMTSVIVVFLVQTATQAVMSLVRERRRRLKRLLASSEDSPILVAPHQPPPPPPPPPPPAPLPAELQLASAAAPLLATSDIALPPPPPSLPLHERRRSGAPVPRGAVPPRANPLNPAGFRPQQSGVKLPLL